MLRSVLGAAASGASAQDAAAAISRDANGGAGSLPALDALEACGILYGAASVPALWLMHGYAAARSWGAARMLLPLTGHGGRAD